MKEVWKFILTGAVTLELPKHAQVLEVREQHDNCCMWVLVDTAKPVEKRGFLVYGTGVTIKEPNICHVGSAHLQNGYLVLHVFEEFPLITTEML